MCRGSGTTKKQFDDLRQQLAEARAAQQTAEQALAALQRGKEGGEVDSDQSVGQGGAAAPVPPKDQGKAKEVKKDGDSSRAPIKIGPRPEEKEDPLATISNGAGDLPVVNQLVCAVQHGLIPPVACFTETHLHHLKSHNIQFLPPAHRPVDNEAKRRCVTAWAPVYEAKHLILLDRFLPAFLKLIATVQAAICKDTASQELVQKDASEFLDDLMRCLGNDGDWRIVREYAFLRIMSWRSQIADQVPWSQNQLSAWSTATWTSAKKVAGAPSSSIRMVPRPESVGVTKTGWGSLTLLAYDETMRKVLDQAHHEDREVGRAVFAHKQPDGELPPSLKRTLPHASAGVG